MKKALLLVLILVNTFITIKAQDVIFLIDGSEISCKVIEITTDKVKYNRFDNLDGPIYILNKNEIFKIRYENGTSDVLSTIKFNSAEMPHRVLVVKPEQGDYVVTKAEDWRGDYLPKIAYGKVYDPEKGKIKRRYYGDGIVFREREFYKFLKLYCSDASKYEAKATTFLVLGCAFIWAFAPCIVFCAISINYSEKILPTYNESCAGLPIQQTVGFRETMEGENSSCESN